MTRDQRDITFHGKPRKIQKTHKNSKLPLEERESQEKIANQKTKNSFYSLRQGWYDFCVLERRGYEIVLPDE